MLNKIFYLWTHSFGVIELSIYERLRKIPHLAPYVCSYVCNMKFECTHTQNKAIQWVEKNLLFRYFCIWDLYWNSIKPNVITIQRRASFCLIFLKRMSYILQRVYFAYICRHSRSSTSFFNDKSRAITYKWEQKSRVDIFVPLVVSLVINRLFRLHLRSVLFFAQNHCARWVQFTVYIILLLFFVIIY